MRLTLYTDYALRMLLYLKLQSDEPSSTVQIAKAYGISQNHLAKIAQSLTDLGYIESIRGRSGGFLLKKPADQINIGELVKTLESSSVLVECFDPVKNTCPIVPVCSLMGVLKTAQDAFFEVLSKYTLEELAPNAETFVEFFKIE